MNIEIILIKTRNINIATIKRNRDINTKITKVRITNTKIDMKKRNRAITKEKMDSSKDLHENTIVGITNMNVNNTMHHEHQHLAQQITKSIKKRTSL
jgi:hypothetical protein